ncbi:hypothetical protein CDIK_0982 [Cucumispora dikerogammari]|nr:hypothetical protein CDIK_0982 [Cucumispora dikerogammari]
MNLPNSNNSSLIFSLQSSSSPSSQNSQISNQINIPEFRERVYIQKTGSLNIHIRERSTFCVFSLSIASNLKESSKIKGETYSRNISLISELTFKNNLLILKVKEPLRYFIYKKIHGGLFIVRYTQRKSSERLKVEYTITITQAKPEKNTIYKPNSKSEGSVLLSGFSSYSIYDLSETVSETETDNLLSTPKRRRAVSNASASAHLQRNNITDDQPDITFNDRSKSPPNNTAEYIFSNIPDYDLKLIKQKKQKPKAADLVNKKPSDGENENIFIDGVIFTQDSV